MQERVLNDIEAAGLSLSVPKLFLDPQKCIQFLGYVVDLGANRLTVDPKRVVKLKALLEKLLTGSRRTHVKDLARVTGLLQSIEPTLVPKAGVASKWSMAKARPYRCPPLWRSTMLQGAAWLLKGT